MTETVSSTWTDKRTPETDSVEAVLRAAGFQRVDAYRYNSASIRVRVVDLRFEGLKFKRRLALVEPPLEQLPDRTQGDILHLFIFTPAELQGSPTSYSEMTANTEFEHPSPSTL